MVFESRLFSVRLFCVAILLLAGGRGVAAGFSDERPGGVLVRFDKDHMPTVLPAEANEIRLQPGERGLVVWTESQGDVWSVFQGTWRRPRRATRQVWPLGGVRGSALPDGASVQAASQLTTQLDPLFLPSVVKSLAGVRGGPLLTPADGGVVLSARPTFRRAIADGRAPPAATLTLAGGGQAVPVVFADQQVAVQFEALTGIPVEWQNGLPAGMYTLTWDPSNPPVYRFRVEAPEVRDAFATRLDQWQQALGSRDDPLHTLIHVESLIANDPQPYLADALDLIERLPAEQRTPHLQWRRDSIVALLQAQPEPLPPELKHDATGVETIDKVRQQIARGLWKDALSGLDAMAASAEPRSRGLADLYRGVIHAEWGLGQEDAADFYFRKALDDLKQASAVDRFRGLNNYGNFLLNRAQDRVLDHAFQMAAGVEGLFVQALWSWDQARRHYEAAEEAAATLSPDLQAAVELNLARLHAIFADILVTLDDPEPTARQLTDAVQAALGRAEQHVERAMSLAGKADPYLVSAAATLRAQLAVRGGDKAMCRQYAMEARQQYLRIGSLTGVECVERLLGFLELRGEEAASGQPQRAARHHFEVAQLLGELLRERLPAERIGRTAAGFFARRSYVNAQLVELLAEEGRGIEALRYAELSKARALQDLLTLQSQADRIPQAFDLQGLLANWPANVVAIEYFLTRDHAWIFVIEPSGQVDVFPLRDKSGTRAGSRQLIAQVQDVLRGEFNQYGSRMRQRILDGSGFDHTWQDRLHGLYVTLLPEPVRQRLVAAEIVLIVPHHILHYLPFAALVSQPDNQRRGPLEMVQPGFVADASYSVTYAPSLATWQLLRRQDDVPLRQVAAAVIPQLPGQAPLPGVLRELNSLSQFFPEAERHILRAQQATRAETLKLLQRPGLLLVGTHGQNYPDEPLASELSLYPSAGDNGRLTAGELYQRQVRSDLVLLSACYTGLADRSPLPGDDLFGLSRALLQAGARTVVTGYWDVFEGTGPDVMHKFFEHLAEGRNAPAALAAAQRDYLARLRASGEPEPYLHPYFWAVYAISGDDRTHFDVRQGVSRSVE